MTTTEELLKTALELPSQDRARLAAALLASLEDDEDEDQDDVAHAWAEEIQRRAERAVSGESVGVPWEEMHARLLARIQRA